MRMTVSDVMTTPTPSVGVDTPFKEVAEILVEHGVGAVPVVDGEHRVIGVVSETDLLPKEEYKEQFRREGYRPSLRARLRRYLSPGRGRGRAKACADTAAGIMTAPAVTVRGQVAAVYAMRLLDEHGVRSLPVVDEQGRLAGAVSRHDLVKVLIRRDEEIAREIRRDILDHAATLDTSGVRISVTRGVVILSGRARTRTDTVLLATSSRRVNGVVDVLNELLWDEDDT
ncbi:CBS domain-containing protein [Nonomuraea sp. ATR24]|uniref:CBS domain-containing protein n=1 Tax=Nonomuraea sp. ATR24 TaxID=1676744 RepID=UPI0035BFE76C